jgi:flagellar hook-associated protein 1 FlgK
VSLDVAFAVARSGLRLLDRQMARAADDIANAGTEGHTRKTLDGRAVEANGAGIGVRAQVVARDVDLALQSAGMRAGGDVAGATLRTRLLGGVEAAHGRPQDGDSLGGLFAALRARLVALREAPEDPIRRSAVVIAAQDLAGRFNGASAAIAAARQDAHDALRTEAEAANAALAEIGRLTIDIRREIAAGRGAATLEDRRDQALARLSESLDVAAIRGTDGAMVLVARGGVVLPTDGSATFSLAPATLGPGAFHGGAGTLPGLMLGGRDVTRQVAAMRPPATSCCRACRRSSTSPPRRPPRASRRRGCGCSRMAPAPCRT